ncbi:unnamed protein product [Lactuca virosa]|uniref:Uncharacterized protein n=1 Tax=Lactuca virosa TaxID=75947 RepID=A0AAU9P4D5_9ASTR|nr:unnamed protein product [Lactuca virosa]
MKPQLRGIGDSDSAFVVVLYCCFLPEAKWKKGTKWDEAYIDSTIGDGGADSESEDNNSITSHPLSLALLKDENDGLLNNIGLLLQWIPRAILFK